jgi:Flp pilus assembly pilin Flp
MKSVFKRFLKSEKGATAVEYALLGVIAAVICFVAIQNVGTKVTVLYQNTAAGFNGN